MAIYPNEVLELIDKYAVDVSDAYRELNLEIYGISEAAIYGCILEEKNDSLEERSLEDYIEKAGAFIAARTQFEHRFIEAEFEKLRDDPDLLDGLIKKDSLWEKLKVFFNPIVVSIGDGQIKPYFAIEKLRSYIENYPDDPLGLVPFSDAYGDLVYDLIRSIPDTTADIVSLFVEEAAAWLSENAQNWNELSVAEKNSLIVAFYNLGKGYFDGLGPNYVADPLSNPEAAEYLENHNNLINQILDSGGTIADRTYVTIEFSTVLADDGASFWEQAFQTGLFEVPPSDNVDDQISLINRFLLYFGLTPLNNIAEQANLMSFSANLSQMSWFGFSTFVGGSDVQHGVYFGNGFEVTVPEGNLTLVALDGISDIDGSQQNDLIYLLSNGSDIFGAGGTDTVSFALLSQAINASLSDNEAINRDGSGSPTELSSIENLTGTLFDDILEGRSSNNVLVGLEGDDSIHGQGGKDTLKGGEGSDTLIGGDDDDRLEGDDGNDSLFGQNDDDTLYGGDGRDEMYGGSDDDRLYGQDGDDTLYGGTGEDYLGGGDDEDHLEGGSGDDELSGGKDDDTLLGGKDDDDLNGGTGNDNLDGGEDDDSLDGNDGQDTLYGRDGHDSLDGGDGDDSLNGGDGNDTLEGGAGENTLKGAAGDDHIYVTDGDHDSFFNGDEGIDTLDFSRLSVGVTIELNSRWDIEHQGNDLGSFGDDFERYILTGSGDDVYGNNRSERYELGSGNDTLIARDGDDTVLGGDGDDSIRGNDDDDRLFGEDGDDTLDGGSGNDSLDGGDGDDNLEADDGNDTLRSGHGNDSLYGQNGDDEIHVEFDSFANELKTLRGGEGRDSLFVVGAAGGVLVTGQSVRARDNGDDRATISNEDIEVIHTAELDDRVWIEDAIQEVWTYGGKDRVYLQKSDTTANSGAGDDYFLLSISTNSGHELDGGEGYDEIEIQNVSGSDVNAHFEGSTLILDWGHGESRVDNIELFRLEDGNYTAEMLATSGPWNVQYHVGTDDDNKFRGTVADDHITMGAGDDTGTGGLGNDTILGGSGDDEVFAKEGDDWLEGGDDDDMLNGGADNDTLIGGAGNDSLVGGSGNDLYIFEQTDGTDLIFGWDSGDVLDFSAIIANAALVKFLGFGIDLESTQSGDPGSFLYEYAYFSVQEIDGDTFIFIETPDRTPPEPFVQILSVDAAEISSANLVLMDDADNVVGELEPDVDNPDDVIINPDDDGGRESDVPSPDDLETGRDADDVPGPTMPPNDDTNSTETGENDLDDDNAEVLDPPVIDPDEIVLDGRDPGAEPGDPVLPPVLDPPDETGDLDIDDPDAVAIITDAETDDVLSEFDNGREIADPEPVTDPPPPNEGDNDQDDANQETVIVQPDPDQPLLEDGRSATAGSLADEFVFDPSATSYESENDVSVSVAEINHLGFCFLPENFKGNGRDNDATLVQCEIPVTVEQLNEGDYW